MFQDLSTGKGIGLGHERGGIYYLDDRMTPTGLVVRQSDLIYCDTGLGSSFITKDLVYYSC